MIETYINISKNKFWIITLLILLVPISKETRLLLFGKRTTAEVVSYRIYHSQSSLQETTYRSRGDYSYKCAVFQFRTENAIVKMDGPAYVKYDLGEKRNVIYDAKHPEKSIMPNIAYLYGFRRCILPILLLLVWIALYTSFKPPKSYIKIKLPEKSKHTRPPTSNEDLIKSQNE